MQIENNKEEKKLIELIKSSTVSNRWINGKAGQFVDFDNNCLYRFCEMNEKLSCYLHKEQEQRNLPVIACGFIVYLIKHWKTDTQNIYSTYLQARLNQYKNEHKNDADVFKRDLEREFYDQYRAKEEQYLKQSETIFDFISDKEVSEIKNYVKYYFEYLQQFETPKTSQAEQEHKTMIDENLTELVKNIEDNLIKHIDNIKNLMNVGNTQTVTKLVLTDINKSYPSTATTEDVLNDPDNVVVSVVPQQMQIHKNSVCLLPKDRRDDLLLKMRTGLTTIQDIKNNIISLSYTNKQISNNIVSERLKDKIPTLNALEYAIIQSIIFNQEIKNSGNDLSNMIKKLNNEIKKVNNPQPTQEVKKETEIKNHQISRTIDEEKLKPYFIPTFNGMGNGNINHLGTIVEELKTNRTAKEFAQIALMIYDSKKMSARKPNTFAEWYSVFCECVVCERKTYKPSQLKPFPEKLTKLFNYL